MATWIFEPGHTEGDADDDDTRQHVVDNLQKLRLHLLEHLDYEERNAGPTIRRLERLAA